MAEGELVRVRFDEIAPKGDAIAAGDDGKPMFAPGVIPGEVALVRIRRHRRNWTAVDVERIEEPSPHRVEPPCPLFETCSGCQLQHVDYPHQLVLKRRMVEAQLRRFGELEDPPVSPVRGAADPWHYRNHARFTVKEGRLGFVRRFRRQWFEVPHCHIMDPEINAVVARLQGEVEGLTQCNIRVGAEAGQRMIQPSIAEAAPHLAGELESGQPHLYETVAGRRFRVSAASFFQVNRAQAATLVEVVRERLGGGPKALVVDAYAGVGTFAVLLAPHVGRVIAIEESGPAVADARENLIGVENVELRLGKSEALLAAIDEPVDAVILDPPRTGCRPEALEAVARLRPRRLIYVSCDAASLGRDLKVLCDADHGFRLLEVQPVDMFPHTQHVECVATLELAGANPA
jgi:23S rRNA (uracil1939-C5)-methyltransferase